MILRNTALFASALTNFFILPYGGALRRPGTEFLGRPKFADQQAAG